MKNITRKILSFALALAMIADGMGRGEEAARCSEFSVRYSSVTAEAGVDTDTLFCTLNEILLERGEECSVAFDALKIDLFSGEGILTKSGAAYSYLKRSKSLFRLKSCTMPLGVMKEADAEKISLSLKSGDMVVMFSDGISDNTSESPWLVEILNGYLGTDPDELAELIMSGSERFCTSDDRTVLVIKLEEIPLDD